MSHNTRRPLSLLALTALYAMSAPTHAATAEAPASPASASKAVAAPTVVADASGTSPPQNVVVTGTADHGYAIKGDDAATGLDLSRRETPQSVSVISRQELQDFGLTDINTALQMATGVTVESVETDRTYYSARGFDIVNFQVDGIGMPFTNGYQGGALDTAFFDSIDVVRGAPGLLSSTGNPSATINLVRKRPTREFEASAGLSLGSWNDRRLEADVGTPLNASGTIRGRVIAVDEHSDSYLRRYHRDDEAFAALLDFDIAPRTTLEVGFMQQDSDANSPMWGALPLTYADGSVASYAWSATTASNWSWWNNTQRRAHVELKHDFDNGWKGTAVLTRVTQAGNSQLFYVYGVEDPVTHAGAQAYPSAYTGQYDQTLANLRLSGPFQAFGRQHSLTVGIDFGREHDFESSGYPDEGIGDALPDLDTWDGSFANGPYVPGDGSNFQSKQTTAYAATHLSLTDGLSLVLGANATRVTSSGVNYDIRHDYARSVLTPYVGAVLDVTPDTSVYASFTRIFNPQTNIDANHVPLAPIQGRNVEAGIKSEWLAKSLQASFAVFQTHQDNTATLDPGDAIPSTYHGENATSTGFETEVTGRLAKGWNLTTGYTQLRIKDDAGQPARTFVPRRQFKLATTYTPGILPGLQVGGSLRWQSQVSTTDDSAGLGDIVVRQRAYAVLGLMARVDIDKHWSAGLNVDNVANDKHWASLEWNQAFYAPPRSWTANLRYTY